MKHQKSTFNIKQFLLLLFLFSSSFILSQEEKIHHFHADIHIDTTGVITVKETISVYVKGIIFKRGIVRGLPKTRTDTAGQNVRVRYKNIKIKKDGKKEKYHTENENGEKVFYIGDENEFLEWGNYTYTIQYETDNQIRLLKNFDEFYWNVNGIGGNIKIDTISASLYLPEGVSPIQSACYTGARGSTAQNCELTTKGNQLHFSYLPTHSNEILTISAAIPKNIIPPPPPPSFLQKTGSLLLGSIITVLMLLYYLFTWQKFGIDPANPTVHPQFNSPDQLSPASVGMIDKGFYWNDLLTASIINLAVKGYLAIEEQKDKGLFGLFKDKTYVIKMIKNADNSLPAEEQVFMKEFFTDNGVTEVEFNGKYDSDIANAVQKYRKSIGKQWNPLIWKGFHAQFWIVPILTIIGYVIMFSFLASSYFRGQNAIKYFLLFLLLNCILFLIYQWLIRKPLKEKLRLKSLIDGFKMYLGAAEEKQLQHFNPPNLTPTQFEAMLPYAIALDSEKIWGKQFQKELQKTMQQPSYHPAWYNHPVTNMSAFSHSINSSLSNSLQHAATSPSSSSGGGFSGGGGGGGSVGGW